jgi:hypothetical protein
VGYWDGRKNVAADLSFRSFGSRPSIEEAETLAKEVVAKQPKEFFY